MKRRPFVLAVTVFAFVALALSGVLFTNARNDAARALAAQQQAALVKPHSPVVGPADAPVTVVEFFDPSCEACRAFYPVVKQILSIYPEDVKLVLRYAAFHEGSDVAVRMLEGARRQDAFLPALEALLEKQPDWAKHDGPDLEKAWEIVGTAGVDIAQAKVDGNLQEVTDILTIDAEDAGSLQVQQTPTFFVNGLPLTEFGPQQLYDLITSEVMKARGS